MAACLETRQLPGQAQWKCGWIPENDQGPHGESARVDCAESKTVLSSVLSLTMLGQPFDD